MKFNENPSTRSPAAHRAHVQTHGLHSCFRVYFCANVGWRSWKKSRSLARGTWCLSVCCDMPVLRRSKRRKTNHNKQENMMLQTTNKRRTIKINIYGIYRHTGDREWETSERSEKKIHNKLHEWKGISVSHAPSQWAHRTNENEKKRLRSCIISFAYKVHVRFFFFCSLATEWEAFVLARHFGALSGKFVGKEQKKNARLNFDVRPLRLWCCAKLLS